MTCPLPPCERLHGSKRQDQLGSRVHPQRYALSRIVSIHVNTHEDIKPPNIFIKEGIQDQWPALKLPVLGDFGLFRMPDFEVSDSQTGTRGFLAPEQQFGPFPSVATTTDIYLIGLNIWCMMRWRRVCVEVNEKSDQHQLKAMLEELETRKSYNSLYSGLLEDLVKRCIDPNLLDRITLPQLLAGVTEGREESTQTTPSGKSPKNCEMDDLLAWNQIIFRENAFEIAGEAPTTKFRSVEWETIHEELQ